MKTLIVFSTKYSTTEECAKMLAAALKGEVDIKKPMEIENMGFAEYDTVIIGSPVYAGQILGEIKAFCKDNMDVLKEKRIAVFTCGMDEEMKALQNIRRAFPRELLDIAVAEGCFGGQFIFERMNGMEKMIIQKMSGLKQNVSKISQNKIEEFAEKLNLLK